MRIRILKNTMGDKCWYAKHVGNVFQSLGHFSHPGMNIGYYEVTDPDEPRKKVIIAAEDCEILADPAASDGKC